MEGQLVRLDQLPSKGILYPDDIELYIKPLSIKEQMEMDRYGISQAEYYTQALQGITVRGDFDRNNLLFHDVQFMDLVRVLYNFDVDEEIIVKDYPCRCGATIEYPFKLEDIEFSDIEEDIFGEDGEGKWYTFSDGLEVRFRPFTISDYIKASRKYISNAKFNVSTIYLVYMALCVTEIKDRVFKDDKAQFEFLQDYMGSLSKNKDRKIMLEVEKKCTSVIEPFITVCPNCGEEVRVRISPKSTFQQ